MRAGIRVPVLGGWISKGGWMRHASTITHVVGPGGIVRVAASRVLVKFAWNTLVAKGLLTVNGHTMEHTNLTYRSQCDRFRSNK